MENNIRVHNKNSIPTNCKVLLLVVFILSSCIQSGSKTVASSNDSKNSFNTIHDLRFSSPPGALDSRLFYGITFTNEFVQNINKNAIVNVQIGGRPYLSASIKELTSNPNVSFIPHSLIKSSSAKITVSIQGSEISSRIVKLKPGSYTKL